MAPSSWAAPLRRLPGPPGQLTSGPIESFLFRPPHHGGATHQLALPLCTHPPAGLSPRPPGSTLSTSQTCTTPAWSFPVLPPPPAYGSRTAPLLSLPVTGIAPGTLAGLQQGSDLPTPTPMTTVNLAEGAQGPRMQRCAQRPVSTLICPCEQPWATTPPSGRPVLTVLGSLVRQ